MASDKRNFTGSSMSSNKQVNGGNSQVGQKIKNFFRINSLGSKDGLSLSEKHSSEGPSTPRSDGKEKSSLRQSRFLPHLGRNRSHTVASEGDALDQQSVSPTAHVNPYFQHQGPPALRHHNDGSVPPSPPDTPTGRKEAAAKNTAAAAAGREELARKLRRVASAPNAQGMFTKEGPNGSPSAETAAMAAVPNNASTSALAIIDSNTSLSSDTLPVPGINGLSPGKIREAAAFRRTYSSNSIKVRDVEVGPGSFDKIKLIGKGDVGKVYLVREKKSARLYAMKGEQSVERGLSTYTDGS